MLYIVSGILFAYIIMRASVIIMDAGTRTTLTATQVAELYYGDNDIARKKQMRNTLQRALDKHIEVIQQLQSKLSNGQLTAMEVGMKLRSHSIDLGQIACMPFREQERE